MLTDRTTEQLARRFPMLLDDAETRRYVAACAIEKHLEPGLTLYREGDETTYLPLLLGGELAVTKIGETGREITLYRIGAGESCILSTLGILNRAPFPATAEVRDEGEVVLVPADHVRALVERSAAWRSFVFRIYNARLTSLIALVEEIVFQKLDVRLAALLLRKTDLAAPVLHWTHQQIAVELGSSREVISRVLKDWQRRGLIEVSRGAVSVVDRSGLEKTAGLVT